MYSKEQSAAAVDKIVRTLRVLDRLFLEIEVVFLICICAIRHDYQEETAQSGWEPTAETSKEIAKIQRYKTPK